MAHILNGYIHKALKGLLEREPTREEFHKAREEVLKYNPKAFDIDWKNLLTFENESDII